MSTASTRSTHRRTPSPGRPTATCSPLCLSQARTICRARRWHRPSLTKITMHFPGRICPIKDTAPRRCSWISHLSNLTLRNNPTGNHKSCWISRHTRRTRVSNPRNSKPQHEPPSPKTACNLRQPIQRGALQSILLSTNTPSRSLRRNSTALWPAKQPIRKGSGLWPRM